MSEQVFSEIDYKLRMDKYFEILSNSSKIKTIQSLLDKVKNEYPEDGGINYNRLQRDIKKFLANHEIEYNNPVEALKDWRSKHYLPISDQDYICANASDFVFDDPCVFIKTIPYEAERMGHRLREIFENLKPFIISDYDTVLVRFKEKEQFDAFKNRFDTYFDVVPDKQDEE